jgi:Ala-tRNA(Pro) deacylase
MPVNKLKKYLDEKNIKYMLISHSPAFTAQEIAGSAHIPGKELAKTVMVKVDDKMIMTVLPAMYKINFDTLQKKVGADSVELASEEEFQDLFPGCELGAMPPFGNLYGMSTLIDKSLTEDEEIVFNACSHRELVKLKFDDFIKLVKPEIEEFAYKHG